MSVIVVFVFWFVCLLACLLLLFSLTENQNKSCTTEKGDGKNIFLLLGVFLMTNAQS